MTLETSTINILIVCVTLLILVLVGMWSKERAAK
jgi:uncharacterized protein YneF (UPF0154 family)